MRAWRSIVEGMLVLIPFEAVWGLLRPDVCVSHSNAARNDNVGDRMVESAMTLDLLDAHTRVTKTKYRLGWPSRWVS